MSIAWLDTLEERVRAASAQLRELRAENEKLRAERDALAQRQDEHETRVAELETELARARATADDDDGWAEERAAVRERVGELIAHLEALLQD